MKFLLKIIFVISAIILLSSGNSQAKPVVAFGYMQNTAAVSDLGYLEFILPNSFANSISTVFDVVVKKPVQLNNELVKTGKSLKKDYEYFELPEFIKEIKSDIFIYGNFTPLTGNQIKIKLNIYINGYREIFTFTNTGKMETQIAKLIDRVSIIIINFMSKNNLYKLRKIVPGSRLSILTNLSGEEQNTLLIAFMRKGYRILCFQSDDIHNYTDDTALLSFRHISTMKNSFDTIDDWRKTKFIHGTWAGERYNESIAYIKKLYEKYDLNYDIVKNESLEKLDSAFNNNMDVLLVIGFSGDRKTSWVRAIDIKDREMIWMQSDIKSITSTSDPVAGNADRIIEFMTEDPANPFIKPDKSTIKQ